MFQESKVIQMIHRKLNSFTQNPLDENIILLSIVEKILKYDICIQEDKRGSLNFVKQRVLISLIDIIKKCDKVLEFQTSESKSQHTAKEFTYCMQTFIHMLQ